MKKTVLALTLAALTTSAFAAEPAPKSLMTETCSSIAGAARATMLARQVGVPLRKVMEVTVNPSTVQMATEAYGTPAYSTQKNQDKAIQEFEDKWYLRCIKTYNQ